MTETTSDINELAAALAAAQAEMVPAKRDAENPFFRSTYADLASVIRAVKPLSDHGIAWVQRVRSDLSGETVFVGCRTDLIHRSGQRLEGDWLCVPVKDAGAQAIGSALTYAKRYSLAATCGVSTEDDDGEAAEGRVSPPPQPAKKSTWKQVVDAPGAVKVLEIVESQAGGTWGIKTNGGIYATQDQKTVARLREANEKGYEVALTAKEKKVGSKTVYMIEAVEDVVV